MARGLIGSLAAMTIREATISTQASREMLRLTRIEQAELKRMRRSNSVDSLSPKTRFLNAMNADSKSQRPLVTPRKEIIFGRAERPFLRNDSGGWRRVRVVPVLMKLFPMIAHAPVNN